MSGWENVPEEAPKRRATKPVATATEPATPDGDGVEDGELARQIDEYFPHAWMAMAGIVCVIAIWKAVSALPNEPSWWP